MMQQVSNMEQTYDTITSKAQGLATLHDQLRDIQESVVELQQKKRAFVSKHWS